MNGKGSKAPPTTCRFRNHNSPTVEVSTFETGGALVAVFFFFFFLQMHNECSLATFSLSLGVKR